MTTIRKLYNDEYNKDYLRCYIVGIVQAISNRDSCSSEERIEEIKSELNDYKEIMGDEA